jgi:phage shock protein A
LNKKDKLMKNSLFKRISRIISANMNSLLSAIENSSPEAVMNQAIVEIEDVIDDVRGELAQVVTAKHLSNKQLLQKNNLHEELTQRIELAMAEGREDLAKAAVSEQLDIEAQLPIMEKTVLDCQEEEKTLEGYLSALKAKVKEMRQDFSNLEEVKQDVAASPNSTSDATRKVENAETAFDQVFNSASLAKGIPGRTGIQQKSKLQELEDLERENRIQERLQSFKK